MKHEPGMAFNIKTLNKVFAFLSVLLLLATFWVFLDDFFRPWKKYQVEALQIKRDVLANQLKKADEEIDQTKVQGLIELVNRGQKLAEERSEQIEALQEQLSKVEADLYAQKLIVGTFNAQVSATNYQHEMAVEKGKPNEPQLRKKLEELQAGFAISRDKIKELEAQKKVIKGQITELQRERIAAEKAIEELTIKKRLLETALKTTEIDIVSVIRNMPFIDFMDPTLKVHQVVLDNYVDDRYFRKIYKVDRCMTCHVNIDQAGYENQNQPFATHPRLELIAGPQSTHPMKQFGCTSCHGGEGHRVNDFTSIAHIPENAEERAFWEKEYSWHEPHKIPREMYKTMYTESQCIKCHKSVAYIPGAEVVNEGRELIQNYGCYACHKIEGVEGWDEMVKPGPSLLKLASKLDKEWVKNWIWNPQFFNQHARMPRYFGQVNNSQPEFMNKNIAEVNSMAEYLWERSKPYRPVWNYSGGSVERGKQIVQEVGCLGCHQADGLDEQFKIAYNKRAPYLNNLGSKVDGNWLVTWLIQPDHYQPDTVMPSFRLSLKEANDVAAFLLQDRNKKFEQLRFTSLEADVIPEEQIKDLDSGEMRKAKYKDLRDEILVTYFSTFDTEANARAKLAKMDDHARTMELGKRSIGKYGCYSCHNIEGFDDFPPIGPELTNIGSKPLTQLGFGHQHDQVEHRRDAWISAHVTNPRRWDEGTNKQFKDLLKMPNFYLKDQEVYKITTYLLGLVDDFIPQRGMHQLAPHEQVAQRGQAVIAKYNCTGCHAIGSEPGKLFGGEILKNYDDPGEGPPKLVAHGARVQSDWLYSFLDNVFPIRPHLSVRMPSFNFSNEELNDLVQYFQLNANAKTFVEIANKPQWEPGERQAAVKLWDNLACTSCHSTGFTKDPALAPNLKLAKRKLRTEWIERWLWDPQQIIPGTLMPSFWIDGESPEPDILGGDSKRQIRALRKLIQEFGYDNPIEPFKYLQTEKGSENGPPRTPSSTLQSR